MVTISEVHFSFMVIGLIGATLCLLNSTFAAAANKNIFKIIIFAGVLFALFSWGNSFLALRNAERFDDPGISEVELLRRKYSFALIQRDCYIQFIEATSLLVFLILPKWHEHYTKTINYYRVSLYGEGSKQE